jgi:hypothetical protein
LKRGNGDEEGGAEDEEAGYAEELSEVSFFYFLVEVRGNAPIERAAFRPLQIGIQQSR